MTQAGGPAAINGFLYQILRHLNWLAEVTLDGTVDAKRVTNARLVLEPRDGGDARAEAVGTYIVEQYKTRANRKWSLSDLTPVLRDLRKSVPTPLPSNARYRFVTDGRPGALQVFEQFLDAVKHSHGPHDLDDDVTQQFRRKLAVTHRAFFRQIDADTRTRGKSAPTNDQASTFHLLAHFEMEFHATSHATSTYLDQRLRVYAPNLGSERAARRQLTGWLLEALSKGELHLDVKEIERRLVDADLSPERARRLERLPDTMRSLTRDRLAARRYSPHLDVRPVPQWPASKPVLLISGSSGSGKTWQLGRLLTAAEDRHHAVLQPAASTAGDVLSRAVHDVWQIGLGETTDKTPMALSNFLRQLDPDGPSPRLLVGVDDVTDTRMALDLVREDWTRLDMRLALCVTDDVAESLVHTCADLVHAERVDDFTGDELAELLRRTDREVRDLPPDLQDLLRKPILAGIYLQLPYASIRDAPHTEYEIFDRFWSRIAATGKTRDPGTVMALAAMVCETKSHPLPRSTGIHAGLEDAVLERLLPSGWITVADSGDIGFTHDRLLNWALARSLAHDFETQRLNAEQLAEILCGEDHNKTLFDRRLFGYVPMDVLWLLAADAKYRQALSQVVTQLERESARDHGETMYAQLLPTLGHRAIPILRLRLDEILADEPGDFRIGFIARGFSALAALSTVDLHDEVHALIHYQARDQQNVGLAALAASPTSNFLDRIWHLHRDRSAALRDDDNLKRHDDYQASFSAMRVCVAIDPQWLRERIRETHLEPEFASELAYLLCSLEHPDAPAIWRDEGQLLMDNVTPGRPRSLIQCIARFGDSRRLDFVIGRLPQSQDFAGGAALTALALVDPVTALDHLAEANSFDRYLSRNQWLPILLRAKPDLTRTRVLELAETAGSPKPIIDIFWERPDNIGPQMLRFVLHHLRDRLSTGVDEALANAGWVGHWLDFLGRVSNPQLLPVFDHEAGGDLEGMVLDVASNRLHTNSNIRDTTRENARRVLVLIGGEGIVTLLRRELDSPHYWIRYAGLTSAVLVRDDRIKDQLRSIAASAAGASDDPNNQQRGEFVRATQALAALGGDAALIDVLELAGPDNIPSDLPALRPRVTIPKQYTERARQTLHTTDPEENAILTALVVATVSSDSDFVPAVHSVLARVHVDGRAARFACIALDALGDTSETFCRLAGNLLRSRNNSMFGLRALARMGDRGCHSIAGWLDDQGSSRRDECVQLAIRVLHANPATRSTAIEAAAQCCADVTSFFVDIPFDIAGESTDPIARRRIRDAAIAGDSISTTRQFRAIEGLARFDAPAAISAAMQILRSSPRSARQLCRLVVDVAPKEAPNELLHAAASTNDKSVRSAIGRALRRLDQDIVSRCLVRDLHGTTVERLLAAEIAAWIAAPEIRAALLDCANNDHSRKVQGAATASLEAHQREAMVLHLIRAFRFAIPSEQPRLLVAMLCAGDPHLLSEPDDILWIGNALSRVDSGPLRYYADHILRQRRQREH